MNADVQVAEVHAADDAAAFLHDAFVSYSRHDTVFAAALEKALERYSAPKELDVPHRRLNIFRDVNDFTGTEYYAAIRNHLRTSRKLLVVCSPAARASTYVNDEIRAFAEVNGSQNIISVLLEGIPNNEATPEREGQMAFPDALLETMRLPLAVDYRGFDPARDRVDRRGFEGPWFSVLANLYDISRSDIEQREKRRQARVRTYWTGAIASIIAALSALSVWALVERRDARAQRDEALRSQSVFLAQESRQQSAAGRTDLGMKVALQALPRRVDVPDRPWVWPAEAALYSAVAQQRFRLILAGDPARRGDSLQGAVIGPDGTRALLNYGVQTELWNLDSGEQIKAFRAAEHALATHVVFSADGRFLAISYKTVGNVIFGGRALTEPGDVSGLTTRGSVVEIIDPRTGDLVRTFQMEGHEENHIEFSPRGSLLFFATDDRLALIDTATWDSTADDTWANIGTAFAPPYVHVTFSEDENRIAVATAKKFIGVIDRSARWTRDLFQGSDAIQGLRFLERDGGSVLAAAGPRLVVFNTQGLEQPIRLPMLNPARVLAVGYAPKRMAIVAITEDAVVHSWPQGKEEVDVNPATARVRLRRASMDDGATAAIVELEDGSVESWNLQSGARFSLLASSDAARLIDVRFDKSGSSTLLASSDGTVRILGRPAAPVVSSHTLDTGGKEATAATFRPQTQQIAIGYSDGSLEIRDPIGQRMVWRASARHQDKVSAIAFDSDGQRLISTSPDRTALLWRIGNDGPPITLAGHKGPVDFAAFSPQGDLIVTGSSDSTFRLWDARSGTLSRELPVPAEYLSSIHNASINAQAAFTSDGTMLVTVTAGDGLVVAQPALVWDVRSGKLLHAVAHDSAAIWHIVITPDDRHLVTTSYDNSAALWDLRSGMRVQTFPGHPSTVFNATVYDGGRLLATASAEGVLRIWRLNSGLQVRELTVRPSLYNLVVSHNGRFLATGSSSPEGSEIGIWDAIDGTSIATIDVPSGSLSPLGGLQFAGDDRSLLTRTRTGAVALWSLPPTGQALIDLAWSLVGKPGEELLTREQRVRFALEAP